VASPFGSAPTIIAGVAIGGAAGAALGPAIEVDRQQANLKIRAAVRDPLLLARLVAAGGVLLDDVRDEVGRAGLTDDKFDALVWLEQTAPGTSELLELWRRDKIDEQLVDLGLAKARLDRRYWPAVKELENARITPETLALAVQRGILENVKNPDGAGRLLTVTPDLSQVTIDSPAQVPLDVLAEAKAWGYDFDRLAVDARIAGLPPAPGELMQLLNRGEINADDFLLGVAEGDTRNEWAAKLERLRFRLLSGVEASELVIRDWLTDEEGAAIAELDGWTPERFELLVKLRGRPLAVHQVTTGLARGGEYPGSYDNVPKPYRSAIAQSNIRREYSELAYANRWTYSVPFWWRALATADAFGDIDPERLLLELGNPPAFAKAVVKHYVGADTSAADPHVTKARNQLWTTLHKAYVDEWIDDAGALEALTTVGVAVDAQPAVLELWQAERAVQRRTLTPAQVKKAVAEGRWQLADAVTRLVQLGYTTADANTLLAE
jgi:hypothetical protein